MDFSESSAYDYLGLNMGTQPPTPSRRSSMFDQPPPSSYGHDIIRQAPSPSSTGFDMFGEASMPATNFSNRIPPSFQMACPSPTLRRFPGKGNKRAFEVMQDTLKPTSSSSVLIYDQPSTEVRHAVNMYHSSGGTEGAIAEFQHSNFGKRREKEVKLAKEKVVFSPGEDVSETQTEERKARREKLCREGKLSIYE